VLSRAEMEDGSAGKCVSCQEEADQICLECGDLYCSRTWMGNPGCFISYHSRGNRINHTLEPLEKPESPRAGDDKKKRKKDKGRKGMKKKDSGKFTLPGIKA
jgi:hypothetical protein